MQRGASRRCATGPARATWASTEVRTAEWALPASEGMREYPILLACSRGPSTSWNCEVMRGSGKSDTRHVEVRLKHLALVRHGRSVLDEVSWTIRPGQRWVLAGGNG